MRDWSLEEALEIFPPYVRSMLRRQGQVSSVLGGNMSVITVEIRGPSLPSLSLPSAQYELLRTEVFLPLVRDDVQMLQSPLLDERIQSLIRGAFSDF
tara:strand:- start:1915 stop:2205 length:291 start_codon:yes stop_codon:yes gene_type:complete